MSVRHPFRIRLRIPVGAVTERTGWLVEGPEGWGECSPLPSWGAEERAAAERFALEAASRPFPDPLRERVEVNMMVPRLPPAEAARLAAASGCRTVKVKVGDDASEERVRAIRETLGPAVRIRLDANGAWDLSAAQTWIRRLARYQIELVEDPVPTLEDLAWLRRRVAVPLAAEAGIRTVEDARRARTLAAADAVVLKPQRLGGIRASLAAAEEAGMPAIASSALETSVGLAAVLAVAAALPELPFACGVGTATLLEHDPVKDPLLPEDGTLAPRRPTVDPALLAEMAP